MIVKKNNQNNASMDDSEINIFNMSMDNSRIHPNKSLMLDTEDS